MLTESFEMFDLSITEQYTFNDPYIEMYRNTIIYAALSYGRAMFAISGSKGPDGMAIVE